MSVVVSPQPNSVVCPETKKKPQTQSALNCYPLSGAANQHDELGCESLFPVPRAGELRNTRMSGSRSGRGLKKQACASHSPDRHWGTKGGQNAISNPFPLAEKLVRPTQPDQPTKPIHPQRLSPGENLASGRCCWPCLAWPHSLTNGDLGSISSRRSSASLTKLMQAHSLFLHSSVFIPT